MGVDATAAGRHGEERHDRLGVFELVILLVISKRNRWQGEFVCGERIVARDGCRKETLADHAMSVRELGKGR
jgi:hypothetical protein